MAVAQSLLDAVKAIADAGKDAVAAFKPGESWSQRLEDFENEIADAMTLAGEASGIPAAVKALEPADVSTLVGALVTDLSFTSPHAQAIIPWILKVLTDGASGLVPDVIGLVSAIKNPPAAA
jgi:hypothetical protein